MIITIIGILPVLVSIFFTIQTIRSNNPNKTLFNLIMTIIFALVPDILPFIDEGCILFTILLSLNRFRILKQNVDQITNISNTNHNHTNTNHSQTNINHNIDDDRKLW